MRDHGKTVEMRPVVAQHVITVPIDKAAWIVSDDGVIGRGHAVAVATIVALESMRGFVDNNRVEYAGRMRDRMSINAEFDLSGEYTFEYGTTRFLVLHDDIGDWDEDDGDSFLWTERKYVTFSSEAAEALSAKRKAALSTKETSQ